ncbi:FkbM family methyltransferase [Roseomonas sp. HJA6]|uniref:FkbM family methyltransferase n=1 Tax=Roseomonas alba TaxID=2846776 RepID=A0ABS7AFT7_9PROT|nr:FkbM family methyltransferase [Neoroseomonas alba]MBW6401033.1 FkbM family methyltransferase [Neoroseomonas alba]
MSQTAAVAAMAPVFRQITKHLPDWRPGVIFDVGANIGQSCTTYASSFPDAAIHAFEPVPETFSELRRRIEPYPNITAHPIGLSCRAGEARMTAIGTTPGNRLLGPEERVAVKTQAVRLDTGAAMADELGVEAISFLKIDTEGHDLDVILGFAPMLDSVDFVQVEASMNPYNRTHVPFRLLEDTLRHFGYLLFNIFEPTQEFKRGGRPVLRRCNPVFIAGRLVDLTGIS